MAGTGLNDQQPRTAIGQAKDGTVLMLVIDGRQFHSFGISIERCGEIMGEYGAGRVLIKPAVPGTGVLAGGPVRAIMELAGVQNVITKSLGTDNAMNIVKAAAEGLKNMESPVQVAERRGISVAEMFGGKEN